MAQQTQTKKYKEKKLVFEKVKYDPLSNPAVFNLNDTNNSSLSPINVDSGWESDEKKDNKMKKNKDNANDNDNDNNDEIDYDKIEANIQRAKKKKKVDFR